ncbi:MAG: hypothetical protein KDA89_17840, partial [Planctomycetaceae bacterium]|nr:hypothetical protein [Planctomycetaceae bacterium]
MPATEDADSAPLEPAVWELAEQVRVLREAIDELREAVTWVTQNRRIVVSSDTETDESTISKPLTNDVDDRSYQGENAARKVSAAEPDIHTVASASPDVVSLNASDGDSCPPFQKQLFADDTPTRTAGVDGSNTAQQTLQIPPDENANSRIENALNQLAEALDAGASEQLTAYLKTLARFHRYSFGNVLLISLQRPDATFVAGFRTWKRKFSRSVRRGEKGIAILAPVIPGRRHSADADDPEDEEPADSPTSRAVTPVAYKTAYVFDVSQTDGESLPKFPVATGSPSVSLDRVRHVIETKGITVKFESLPEGSQGQSTGGEITVSSGLSPAEAFRTLVHEWAHEDLHKGDQRSRTTKTIRETEAEAVAFVVCTAAGIDRNTVSSDYIRLYQGDRETLAESLQHIRRCA